MSLLITKQVPNIWSKDLHYFGFQNIARRTDPPLMPEMITAEHTVLDLRGNVDYEDGADNNTIGTRFVALPPQWVQLVLFMTTITVLIRTRNDPDNSGTLVGLSLFEIQHQSFVSAEAVNAIFARHTKIRR